LHVDSGGKGEVVVPDFVSKLCSERALRILQGARVSLEAVTHSLTLKVDDQLLFIQSVFRRESSLGHIETNIESVFPELDENDGVYAKFSQSDERQRCICAMLSLIRLHYNDYAGFTACQPPAVRMTKDQWSELRDFMEWVSLDQESFTVCLVLLAIRGLGKIKTFAKMLPVEEQSPESVVLHLLESKPHIVPSTMALGSDSIMLLRSALNSHSNFNLAQMLQGENLPLQIERLKSMIVVEGEHLLKFYLVVLLATMCALRGAEAISGSLFMDLKNGSTVMMGIQRLRFMGDTDCCAIYWSYIAARAKELDIPYGTPDDMVLARLACLTRAKRQDCKNMNQTWQTLSRQERARLTGHFLADGVHEFAIMLAFLPDFLLNSKNNSCVGLSLALHVLCELLEVLLQDDLVLQCREIDPCIKVDMSDLGKFARDVVSKKSFEALSGHVNVVRTIYGVKLQVSTKHWHSVDQPNWRDESSQELFLKVNQMSRQMASSEEMLELLVHGITPGTESLDCDPEFILEV